MLIERYLTSTKNVSQIFEQMIKGAAPNAFNSEYLKSVGFGSSTDRAFAPLLKSLGFLNDTGQPTPRYHSYRAGGAEAKAVLGEALLEAYEDLFQINVSPSEGDRRSIEGKFKSAHNVTDRVAEFQTTTFLSLLKLADIEGGRKRKSKLPPELKTDENKSQQPIEKADTVSEVRNRNSKIDLRYKIEVHLPPTKDIEVYNAIFKSLKENLLD